MLVTEQDYRRWVAGHEAGHAVVASLLRAWPEVTITPPPVFSGNTNRLTARNKIEDIAINRAGGVADELQCNRAPQLAVSQSGDNENLRTRHPGISGQVVNSSLQLARKILLENRDSWMRVRDSLLRTDFPDWKELVLLVEGDEARLVCGRCEQVFEIDNLAEMMHDVDGRQVCEHCSAKMPDSEQLANSPFAS